MRGADSQPCEGWLYADLGIRTASMPETMEFWCRLHGCTGEDWQRLSHRRDTGRARAALITWTGCTTGGAVQLLRVAGGGHVLPTLAPDTAPKPDRALNHDGETAGEVWALLLGREAGTTVGGPVTDPARQGRQDLLACPTAWVVRLPSRLTRRNWPDARGTAASRRYAGLPTGTLLMITLR